jgi:hypothetical protein
MFVTTPCRAVVTAPSSPWVVDCLPNAEGLGELLPTLHLPCERYDPTALDASASLVHP